MIDNDFVGYRVFSHLQFATIKVVIYTNMHFSEHRINKNSSIDYIGKESIFNCSCNWTRSICSRLAQRHTDSPFKSSNDSLFFLDMRTLIVYYTFHMKEVYFKFAVEYDINVYIYIYYLGPNIFFFAIRRICVLS